MPWWLLSFSCSIVMFQWQTDLSWGTGPVIYRSCVVYERAYLVACLHDCMHTLVTVYVHAFDFALCLCDLGCARFLLVQLKKDNQPLPSKCSLKVLVLPIPSWSILSSVTYRYINIGQCGRCECECGIKWFFLATTSLALQEGVCVCAYAHSFAIEHAYFIRYLDFHLRCPLSILLAIQAIFAGTFMYEKLFSHNIVII